MPAYPDENDTDFDSQWDAWWEAKQASRQEEGFSASLDSFWRQCLPAFLSGQEGENRVCSPLNIYLSLAMLAELTDGDSREQILGPIGQRDHRGQPGPGPTGCGIPSMWTTARAR